MLSLKTVVILVDYFLVYFSYEFFIAQEQEVE